MEVILYVIAIFVAFLFVVYIVFLPVRLAVKSQETKAVKKDKDVAKKIEELQSEIIVVSTQEIPGKRITKILGMARGVSDTQASIKEEFDLAEKEALYKMMLNAKSMGANAVIDVRTTTGTYEQQGNKWQVSQVIYTGTAVVAE